MGYSKREYFSCKGTTKKGLPCEAPATWTCPDGKSYCARHLPETKTPMSYEDEKELDQLYDLDGT